MGIKLNEHVDDIESLFTKEEIDDMFKQVSEYEKGIKEEK